MMNRRAFFATLAAGLAAAADPERLLWVPGRKFISIAAPPSAGNGILTSEMLARDALAVLKSKMSFIRQLQRDYDAQFSAIAEEFYGGTGLVVRRPCRFVR